MWTLPSPWPTSGADLFISVWNLHHSPYLWKEPDTFRPERFEEVNTNPDFGGKWAGERAHGIGLGKVWQKAGSMQAGHAIRKCTSREKSAGRLHL
jgi:hypothetical protein